MFCFQSMSKWIKSKFYVQITSVWLRIGILVVFFIMVYVKRLCEKISYQIHHYFFIDEQNFLFDN